MSATGDLDVRVPIGALFTILGLLLTAYGFLEPAAVKAAFTKGGQINMWWGLAMLVFGIFMLLVARPPRERAVP
jgi:predicted phage tail protein